MIPGCKIWGTLDLRLPERQYQNGQRGGVGERVCQDRLYLSPRCLETRCASLLFSSVDQPNLDEVIFLSIFPFLTLNDPSNI
jgi:hypothetical protein